MMGSSQGEVNIVLLKRCKIIMVRRDGQKKSSMGRRFKRGQALFSYQSTSSALEAVLIYVFFTLSLIILLAFDSQKVAFMAAEREKRPN